MTRVLAMLPRNLCTQRNKAVDVLIDNGVSSVSTKQLARPRRWILRYSMLLHIVNKIECDYCYSSIQFVVVYCNTTICSGANVVVAGSGRVGTSSAAADDDSNLSLLLCSETIPGSPAPDAEPAPPRQRLHMPFACAPPHHQHKGIPTCDVLYSYSLMM